MKSFLHLLTDAAIGESSISAHFRIFSQVTTARTETLKQATMGRKNSTKQQQQTKPMPEKKAAPAPEPKKQPMQQPQPAAKEAPAATKGGKKGGKK
ncbi:hypothetical protein FI667_g4452, partial [Globisporangium splendens]